MELQKGGDGDHSTEMQSALKRFEDVCNSLEDEHTKLLELEKRRQKLNEDLERLRNEIKEEQNYFRSVIGEQVVAELDDVKQSCSSEQSGDMVEPPTLDTGAIKEFIQNQKKDIASQDQEVNLEELKENLKPYGESYIEEQFEDNDQQRQDDIAEHLDEVEAECNEEETTDEVIEVNSDELLNEDFDYLSSEED